MDIVVSLKEGPYVFREILDPSNEGRIKMQEEEDLSDKELVHHKVDIKLKNIIMYGLSNEIYNSIVLNPLDKINKRKANGEGNDKHVTGRTEWYEPITKKRMVFSKCYYCQKPKHKIRKCFEYMSDRKIAKRERELQEEDTPCSCNDCGSTSSTKGDEPEDSLKA
ncbi:hypothetical protein Tco_0559859 [Tanacetum coccineum]